MSLDYLFIYRSLPLFMEGLIVTLQLSILAIIFSVIWGLIIVLIRLSPSQIAQTLAVSYIEVVRNTPVLVQMYFIFFGSAIMGFPLSGFVAGLIALVIQNGGYLAEIFRAGIQSISKHQGEAGIALGMQKRQLLSIVILPQAIRRVLPPVGNQGVLIIKDTSLVATLSVIELTYQARIITDRSAAAYEVFLTLALFYLAITTLFSLAVRYLESRLRY